MTGFEKYGVPADGWAAGAGPRPSRTPSGTRAVPDLGPNQLAWLRQKEVFFDANLRALESRGGAP